MGDEQGRAPQTSRCLSTSLLLAAGLFSSVFVVRAETDPELEEPSLWSHFVDLRSEAGYRDNPTYASSNPSGSTFGTLKFEYTLVRLPVDQWQIMALTTVDATRFFDSVLTDHEVFTFSLLQIQKETVPGRTWEAGFQHVYQDQVVDASTTIVNQGSVAIHGHTLQGYASWKEQWASGWWLRLKPAWEWQTVAAPLDDSYEPGFSFSVGQELNPRTSYSVAYDFQERVFDQMTPTDVLGVAVPGDALRFRQHQIEGTYRRELDQMKQWRVTARLSWLRNQDNGQGYYDYDRGRMALDLRWRKKPWEIKLSSRASYYDYNVQAIAGAGSEMREKALLAGTLQLRREFKSGWYLVLRGEHEQSLSNLTTDRYVANLLCVGVGWEN